jgi:hypothetical protein
MTHRATIERNVVTDTNPYGHKGPPEWAPLADALVCFFYTRRGRESAQVERTAVVEELALLAPLGSDITERDRINGVTDRAGAVLLAGVQNVRTILPHHSHLEITLEQVA